MRTPLSFALAATLASVAPAQDIEYTVGLYNAHTQTVDMSMSIRGREVRSGELTIALPIWRPGRYALVEPATTIHDVTARTGAGTPLEVRKQDKSSWGVLIPAAAPGNDELIISYRVHANSIADRTRHADDTHAFLSPATVFMYAPAFRSHPLRIRIDAPENWKIATGLEQADRNTFIARDYDELVDSPLEIGHHETLRFDLDGTPHEIAIWNPTTLARTLEADRITADFAKIVSAQRHIFGDLPYRRYIFLIHAYPGGRGGTEHLNSTIMQTSPESLRDQDTYKKFLGLVSHEFFHTWNVKQFRPAGLKPYDYQGENYTGLLWVAEGVTSYYDDLTLARTGIIKPDDYLKALSGLIDSHGRRPGAAVQSLEESSFDAWVKFNKVWPDSINTTVSFYDKGALVSFLLDMEIRSRSQNRASLDDVLRELYRRFPLSGPGYTSADVQELAEHAAGSDLAGFFDAFVAGTDPLPFGDAVGVAGLELVRDSDSKSAKPYLGLNIEARDGLAAVTSVLADGPAHNAGVITGDLISAINSQRIRTQAELDTLLKSRKPGETLTISFFRYDTLREITLELAERPDGKWTLRRVESPTDEQKRCYRSWLGSSWPGEGEDPHPAKPADPP
jgi:predicted metalloprotease with PDZ domain